MIETIISTMPMMVCGVLSALLALSLFYHDDKPRRRLFFFMVTATLLYLAHAVFYNHLTGVIPLTDSIYGFCNPAVFPLYLIYVEELTQYRPNRRRQALYLLPSVFCFVAVSSLYLIMSETESDAFIHDYLYGNNYKSLTGLAWWQGMAHLMVKTVFALQIPPSLVMCFRHIGRYHEMVDNNYSNTEGKHITRVQTVLVLFTIASIVGFTCNLIGRYQFTDSILLLTIPSLLFSLLLLLIGHVGLSQQFYVQDLAGEVFEQTDRPAPWEHTPLLEQSATEIPDKRYHELLERIRKLVVQERLYLQPNLKISDLAQRLNTNRNYIYNAINGEMGMSFSDFINRQRIDHASSLLENQPGISIQEVMVQSGFTSTSAFYRNYKKFKGSTPTENRTRN